MPSKSTNGREILRIGRYFTHARLVLFGDHAANDVFESFT